MNQRTATVANGYEFSGAKIGLVAKSKRANKLNGRLTGARRQANIDFYTCESLPLNNTKLKHEQSEWMAGATSASRRRRDIGIDCRTLPVDVEQNAKSESLD